MPVLAEIFNACRINNTLLIVAVVVFVVFVVVFVVVVVVVFVVAVVVAEPSDSMQS